MPDLFSEVEISALSAEIKADQQKAHLIIVDANDSSNFNYTDFDTGADASNYIIAKGDRLSWIVFRAAGLIGYRIDFNKNGTPFETSSIVVPNGGLAPQQQVGPAGPHGYGYTITLSNFAQDDPQVEPYDSLQLIHTLGANVPVSVPISVTIVNGVLSINDQGPYAPLSIVYWQGDRTLQVDFSQSGQNPPSPFVDLSGGDSPLGHRSNGTTYGQQIRPKISGNYYNYTISMGGITQQFVFAVS